MAKKTCVKRKTRETDIRVAVDPYGKGAGSIKTGIAFLDHMLVLFARHGLFDMTIAARGDLDVDIHHTNEDVALTLGDAFSRALGTRAGIKRFGEATIPMDEALARAVVDISGRPFLKFQAPKTKTERAQGYSLSDAEHFMRAFATKLGASMHIDVLEGRDLHHVLEAVFKATAKALMRAVEREPRSRAIPSTKGKL